MNETAASIPLGAFIPILTAISDRNWLRFKELELEFADNHGVETWADVFNFRIMPALEPEAKRWMLVEKCETGDGDRNKTIEELRIQARELSKKTVELSRQAREIPVEPKENRKRKQDLMRQARDASHQCQALIQEIKRRDDVP